jgi:hypothetical protein
VSAQTHGADGPIVRRCKAVSSRTGQPCRRTPIAGGFVCIMHGGSAGQVKRKARERLRDMLGEALDPNNSLREAGRLAYSDIRELFNAEGKLISNPKEWPDNVARAVASIEQDEITGNVDKGDGKRDRIIRTKVRLWDKPGSLENLMKTHGQLAEKQDININVHLTTQLQDARRRFSEHQRALGVVDSPSVRVLPEGDAAASNGAARK